MMIVKKAGARIGKGAGLVPPSDPPLPRPSPKSWMRLPKYSNPHFAADATRTVSRKTLQLQDDADHGVERSGEVDNVGLDEQEVEDLHVKLGEIVSKRIKLKRALAPSDEPHSKKRRKILAEEGDGNRTELEPVGEFKSSCSPQAAAESSPSLPFGLKFTAAPCPPSDPETSQSHTVSRFWRHRHSFRGG